ncbi:hypothetical protein EVG20_g4774 [Dentipellis fragilis]|uniref:Transaldolase n=1 Tax=Dentipellis fragilis TaxID=205917 RepID=A0A4Y9YX31_9AGAM|nr:hypothetical protein EVG20_g4774 [Dentipellis fragilis]
MHIRERAAGGRGATGSAHVQEQGFEREGSVDPEDEVADASKARGVESDKLADSDAPVYPQPRDSPSARPYLFAGLRAGGVKLVADTLDWDGESRLPSPPLVHLIIADDRGSPRPIDCPLSIVLRGYGFNATKTSPKTLWGSRFADQEVLYFLWVAVHKKLDVNLGWTNNHQKICSSVRKIVFQQFLAELGSALMEFVDGDHVTFVDYRLHDNGTEMQSQRTSLLTNAHTIPATAQGIEAAARLSKGGIKVNLDLVTNVAHAALCAEAGAYSITVPVAEMLEWHKTRTGKSLPYYAVNDHPLFDEIQTITAYFRLCEIRTLVFSGALQHENEACSLATLDAISFDSAQAQRSKWYNRYPPLDTGFEVHVVEQAMAIRSARKKRGLEHDLSSELAAESVSMASAVVYTQLGETSVEMAWLEKVVDCQIKRRLEYYCTSFVPRPELEKCGKTKRKRECGDTPPRTQKSRRVGDAGQELFCLESDDEHWEPATQKCTLQVESKVTEQERPPTRRGREAQQPKRIWDDSELWPPADNRTDEQEQPANPETEYVDPMDEVF